MLKSTAIPNYKTIMTAAVCAKLNADAGAMTHVNYQTWFLDAINKAKISKRNNGHLRFNRKFNNHYFEAGDCLLFN